MSVPNEASNLTLPKVGVVDLYFHTNDKEYEDGYISVGIPQGYELLGIYPELTEEQAHSLVERLFFAEAKPHPYYVNYTDETYYCDTALESFQSLMERENITGFDKYAILIKSK